MKTRYSTFSGGVVPKLYRDNSQLKIGAERFTKSHYPGWILLAELDPVSDFTTSGKKRFFVIISRSIPGKTDGKAIRRIVIFDNHPESLRLLSESGVYVDSDDATERWERRVSVICGSILIAIILPALFWLLYL